MFWLILEKDNGTFGWNVIEWNTHWVFRWNIFKLSCVLSEENVSVVFFLCLKFLKVVLLFKIWKQWGQNTMWAKISLKIVLDKKINLKCILAKRKKSIGKAAFNILICDFLIFSLTFYNRKS